MLEIIAVTLKDAIDIDRSGADRIELVTGIEAGGLTPSIGLTELVCDSVEIPVNVMVRPHANSFIYNEEDIKVILNDIEAIKKTKAYGIVFGALTKDLKIDEELLKKVIKAKGHLSLTFHRAIDASIDPIDSLKTLMKYDVDRILTSGGKDRAVDAIEVINQMDEIAKKHNKIILAGSGLYLENIEDFLNKTTVDEIHVGSGVKINKKNSEAIDPNAIYKVKNMLKRV